MLSFPFIRHTCQGWREDTWHECLWLLHSHAFTCRPLCMFSATVQDVNGNKIFHQCMSVRQRSFRVVWIIMKIKFASAGTLSYKVKSQCPGLNYTFPMRAGHIHCTSHTLHATRKSVWRNSIRLFSSWKCMGCLCSKYNELDYEWKHNNPDTAVNHHTTRECVGRLSILMF